MNTRDPVCGMDVDPDEAAAQSEYQGETYYFCCNECKQRFDKDPKSFAHQPKAGSRKS